MPKYSLLWVLGVAGVVCWVIKLLGCQAAGSFLDPLLCTWSKVIQQRVQLCASNDCCANGLELHKKGVSLSWTAWRMVGKGEYIGYCPGYHQQAYCNVYCLLPAAQIIAAAF